MEQLDDSSCQTAGKRKLACCEPKGKKRKVGDHKCLYCYRTFYVKRGVDDHTRAVHKCDELVLTEEIRAEHQQKHEEEKRQKAELEMQRKLRKDKLKKQRHQKEEDLVYNYIRADKLDEYESDSEYEPDICNISYKYGLDDEEVFSFMKRFKVEDILFKMEHCFSVETIIYLMENEAVSIEEVSKFLDYHASNFADLECFPRYDCFPGIVSYFLDEGYEIKREWITAVIHDDEVIERIKEKFTFTFDEIYGGCAKPIKYDYIKLNMSVAEYALRDFYDQVHKHFPDPEYEDLNADPFIDFEEVSTKHVNDYLHSQYFYNEESDELFIVVSSIPVSRKISLGECTNMLQMDLEDLIEQYNQAIESYEDAKQEVSELFKQKEKDLHDGLTEKERLDVLDWYDRLLYRGALQDRNAWANAISMLYFVIARK